MTDPLTTVLAKSAGRGRGGEPELLITHSTAVRDTVRVLAARIGGVGVLATAPRFWSWAEQAGLLHDSGKVAAGFQNQLQPGGEHWGHRHELLSLGFVDALFGADAVDRVMVATGVAFHHRQLYGGTRSLQAVAGPGFDWERVFGRDPQRADGQQAQVRPHVFRAFLAWFASELGVPAPTPGPDDRKLWQRARDRFDELVDHWQDAESDDGLLAVLLQGAVTLADHAASGHVELQRHMPVSVDYLKRLDDPPYPHQRAAGRVTGHIVLRAPTGSGKTEAGLAWVARQLQDLPGEPRLVWTLPYRASIDAIADRFTKRLDPAPGETTAEVGILHGKVAQTLLARACDDDTAPTKTMAQKATAEAAAARLFVHRLRVATPYQLLRAAVGGPNYSSLLLDQANSLFVFDELHAYDPQTFGRICAAMRLWEQLGSRVAVLSATLAPQLVAFIKDSLRQPILELSAGSGTAPDRHRLVIDSEPIDSPASLDRIRGWLAEGHSVLAVANTVVMAQRLYETLAPAAQERARGDDDAAMLLHSRFRGRDRSAIEGKLMARHGERGDDDPARRGGLVVATQTVEVSLCLDFDRGVSEVAPVESAVQRMGRVNRRGRHPDGRVEFRVHAVNGPAPYPADAIDIAWHIMSEHNASALTEEALAHWLARAYESPWGRGWLAKARDARDRFATAFLDFADPFKDRSEFAQKLEEAFDTVEVLRGEDVAEYEALVSGETGHPLLAAGLLIPIRLRDRHKLAAAGLCHMDRPLSVEVIDGIPYSTEKGLDLAGLPDSRRETIL